MPESSGQERTEAATPRRRQEARKRGQVARSPDLPAAVALLAGTGALRITGPLIWQQLQATLTHGLSDVARPDLTRTTALHLLEQSGISLVMAVVPVLLTMMIAALGSGVLQTGLTVTPASLSPKFERINPLEGMKRLFSARTGFELLKMTLRLVILAAIVVNSMQQLLDQLLALGRAGFLVAPQVIGAMVFNVAIRVAIAGGILAALDYAFQRWKFEKDLRMTKQEVKDEQEESEGDPQIKARIRKLQAELARKRMMQEVPTASVVIANPTHFAVALRYVSGKQHAPVVVARGQDHLALQIREIARKHGVPIVENPPLARALYAAVRLDQEIPFEFYKAVAEVLAFVYRIKRRW